MNKKQSVGPIKKYLEGIRPLGNKAKIKNIDFLGGGNHYNYKVVSSNGNFVVRTSRPDSLGAGALYDIPDEYTLLKLIEKYKVAPKAASIDLENFSTPLLIEEYITGTAYDSFKKINKQKIQAVIDLMLKVSTISLTQTDFPFRFSYNNYNTNIKAWKERLKEIKINGGNIKLVNDFIKETNKIIKKAEKILLTNQPLLDKTKKAFIYNDVHAGNIFWMPKTKKAIFIDWQKVSMGDPTFMLAVFALAFEDIANIKRDVFFSQIIEMYEKRSKIKNIKKLFELRILEREVSNMIWHVWATLKCGKKLSFNDIEKYTRYTRTRDIISTFHY